MSIKFGELALLVGIGKVLIWRSEAKLACYINFMYHGVRYVITFLPVNIKITIKKVF